MLSALKIKSNNVKYMYCTSALRFYKLGLRETLTGVNPLTSFDTRRKDMSTPGDYLINPGYKPLEPDSAEVHFVESTIKLYLADDYYDPEILNFVKSYDLMELLGRDEFYFDFYSNDTFMIISGAYDKFAHIIVFTSYDSKQSFIDKARHFFKLPDIDTVKVEYDEYECPYPPELEFFYSYEDIDKKFKLIGYQVFQSTDVPDRQNIVTNKYIAIDLTIYAEGEE